MHTRLVSLLRPLLGTFVALVICVWTTSTEAPSDPDNAPPPPFPGLPRTFSSDKPLVSASPTGKMRTLTIDPRLQKQLSDFIESRGAPIASVVVVEVKTGRILAMAEGMSPKTWSETTEHSALHSGFPAASIFKVVVSSAVFDILDLDGSYSTGLLGGCAQVHPSGVWLNDPPPNHRNQMSHARAFGHSCNGFFAKLGVSQVGLSGVAEYARRFGWGQNLPADFAAPASPIQIPNPASSSAHTIGQFSAGFGYVGMSPLHAAWIMLTVANDGKARYLRLFDDEHSTANTAQPLPDALRPTSAYKLRQMMANTIMGGTASYAFRPSRYRVLRPYVGGKTGTLTGLTPAGLTTWFAGLMPLDNPQVAVAAVVVLPKEGVWYIKGPNLAAEAFRAYYDLYMQAPANISHNSDNPSLVPTALH